MTHSKIKIWLYCLILELLCSYSVLAESFDWYPEPLSFVSVGPGLMKMDGVAGSRNIGAPHLQIIESSSASSEPSTVQVRSCEPERGSESFTVTTCLPASSVVKLQRVQLERARDALLRNDRNPLLEGMVNFATLGCFTKAATQTSEEKANCHLKNFPDELMSVAKALLPSRTDTSITLAPFTNNKELGKRLDAVLGGPEKFNRKFQGKSLEVVVSEIDLALRTAVLIDGSKIYENGVRRIWGGVTNAVAAYGEIRAKSFPSLPKNPTTIESMLFGLSQSNSGTAKY